MLRFPTGRRIIDRVLVWRCLHYKSRTPSCLQQPQPLFCSNFFSRGPSTLKLLSTRPVSWYASRFSHHDSQNISNEEGSSEKLGLKSLTQAPRPALYLGFSGLIPFISAPLLMVASQSFYPEVAYAQVVYGACIVSFLGGVRWGFAVPAGSPAPPDWKNLGNSVVPSLLAWLALLCWDNITEGALTVIMGLGLSLHYDLVLLPGYPAWFKAMRTVLTVIATFSLVATLTIKKFYTEKKFRELKD